jgi:hypothetical protein
MKRSLQLGAAIVGLVGLACLGLYFSRGQGAGKLTWEDPVVRKSLMTFVYKIYSEASAENGRFFLSKMVFHNEGTGPVRDLSISYQIPDYISWTTPQTHPEIFPGQTVVELYYPQLPSKVTQLTNQTNATLETKIRWSNGKGEMKEEILRSPVILRGVNEVEYTDLPADECSSWQDMWSTAYVTAAMVTPNDPVLKEYVAEITKRSGGTTAGFGGGQKEVYRIMKAVYDYMCETGLRYTSDAGVPAKIGDVSTVLQTVRMPRDVIITNEGLCIELTLLWASIMEHLGLPSTIVFVPRHAFVVVNGGGGESGLIPVECTAITPMAVGKKEPVSFDEAISMAAKEFDQWSKEGYMMAANVQFYQSLGFRPPELPSVEVDKIKNILAQRGQNTAASYVQNARRGGGNTAANNGQVRPGYYRWTGVNNTVSIDVPETWARTENTAVPGLIFVAEDAQTSVGADVFLFPRVSNPAQGMELTQQSVSHAIGARVKVASHEYKGNSIVYTGHTIYRNGSTADWVGLFVPTPNGVVGLFIGAGKGQFQRNQSIIRDIISTARIESGGGQGNGQNQDGNNNNNDENN